VRDLLVGREGEFVDPELPQVLEESAPTTEKNRGQILGKALDRWKGRVIGGRRLVRGQDRKTKVATWSIGKV
jgi:hypothetical protein